MSCQKVCWYCEGRNLKKKIHFGISKLDFPLLSEFDKYFNFLNRKQNVIECSIFNNFTYELIKYCQVMLVLGC